MLSHHLSIFVLTDTLMFSILSQTQLYGADELGALAPTGVPAALKVGGRKLGWPLRLEAGG